jgi:hypothetical protein
MSNLDLNAAKRIMYMLSNFYPERMGQCLIVSAPIMFSAAWAVIRPWLWRRTQTKVQFCKAEELGRWIAPAALPSFWGGLDSTIYSARSLSLPQLPRFHYSARWLSPSLCSTLLSPSSLSPSLACAPCVSAWPCTMRLGSPPLLSFPLPSRGRLFRWGASFPCCSYLTVPFSCMRMVGGRGNRDLDEGAAQKA